MGAAVAAAPTLATFGKMLAMNLGLEFGTNLIGSITGGTSPYEANVRQQAGIGQSLIPQLQAQAMGHRTAASDAIMRQVRQNTTSAQQSYAAGATARQQGGTPVAANLDRYRQAETQTLGNVLGQQQASAQSQLANIYQTGVQAQGVLEQMEYQAKGQFMAPFMQFLGQYSVNKADPQFQRMYDLIRRVTGLDEKLISTPGSSNIAGQFKY
jgi:hypothetical protein